MTEKERQAIKRLAESANSVLTYLDQNPPYFSNGEPMDDLQMCLEDLEWRIKIVKEDVLGEQA
jgi:hypothetical protein